MVDGSYTIQVPTLRGKKKPGKVILRSEGDVVHADVDAPVIGKQQAEGKLVGDTFTAEGTFKIKLLGKASYTLRGVVEGDDLHIEIDSNKGKIELDGVRD